MSQLSRPSDLIYGNVDVGAIELDSNIDETIDKGLAKPLEAIEYWAILVEVDLRLYRKTWSNNISNATKAWNPKCSSKKNNLMMKSPATRSD